MTSRDVYFSRDSNFIFKAKMNQNLGKMTKFAAKYLQLEEYGIRLIKDFPNLFPFLHEVPNKNLLFHNGNSLKVLYHNIFGLLKKLDDIRMDPAVQAADILLFTNCHTSPKEKDKLTIDGFTLLHLTGSKNIDATNGLACYVKDEIKSQVIINHNADASFYCKDDKFLEICLVTLIINGKVVHIASLHRNKGQSLHKVMSLLKSFLRKHVSNFDNDKCSSNLFMLCDLDVDSVKECDLMETILEEFNLNFINPAGFTTCDDYTLDLGFSKRIEDGLPHNLIIYESYYSIHKPLWLYIKKE